MKEAAPTILRFSDYSLDRANAQLRRQAEVVPLRPKTLAVLCYLVENAGRLVTKAELLDAVWADTAVTEWVLTSSVKELRRILGDERRTARIIETAHGRGYRFVAKVQAVAAGVQAPAASPASLVGRDDELGELRACWQRARAGERQIILVAGEAGIGKTTLVDEFLRELESNEAGECLIVRGQCLEQLGAGEAYLPVLEALGQLCAPPQGELYIALLRRHAPSWLMQFPGLLEAAERETLERRMAGGTRESMLREMAAFIEALPAPLVLVLEDLHWSDRATLDLVSMLAQRRATARVLIVGTFRPVDLVVRDHPMKSMHHTLRAHGQCHDLWLQPLGESDVAAYLQARWPGLSVIESLAGAVCELTDGNPLFLVNVADYLIATDAVTQVEGRWTLRGDVASLGVGVPHGLRPMIALQIDRLEDAERTLLEVGSLIGRTFSAALVAAALDADVVAVDEQLVGLARRGLMVRAVAESEWPDQTAAGAYQLTHFLYQSVLRDRVSPARRRQLHARIAQRLEQAYGDRAVEIAAQLAFHFESSGEPDRAVPYLEEGAARALRLGANGEAVMLIEHGLALLDALPRTPERTLRTIRLCIVRGTALAPARGFGDPDVEASFVRACALSEESADQVQLFQSLIALTLTHMMQARFERATETVHHLSRLAGVMPLPPFQFADNFFNGMVSYHAGALSDARRHLEEAVAIGEIPLPPLSADMHAANYGYLSLVLLHQGYPDQARACRAQAAARAATAGRPFDRSGPLQLSLFLHLSLRDMEELARLADEANALATAHGFAAVGAIATVCRGRVLSAEGEHARGIELIREGIEAYRASGQRLALHTVMAVLAEALAEAGDIAEALTCVDEALILAETARDVRYKPELHRLEGVLRMQCDDRVAAASCIERAIALAQEQGSRWWELRATASWVRLQLQLPPKKRERRAALDALAAIAGTFAEGLDTADLKEARRLLAAEED